MFIGSSCCLFSLFFFFNDTATTEIYTLSLHDALPISLVAVSPSATWCAAVSRAWAGKGPGAASRAYTRVRSDGPTRIALSTGGGPLMFVVPLIERKRDGGALTPEEWSALVAAYTAGRVP